MISVHQIYFDEKSEKGLEHPAFIPFKNEVQNDFFENDVMRRVYNEKLSGDAEYVGISSWKQFGKTHIHAHEIINSISTDILARTIKDVYLYSPIIYTKPTYQPTGEDTGILVATIKEPDIWHVHRERFDQIVTDTKLLNDAKILPFDLRDGLWQYSYCNYWIAKKQIFNEYMETVLLPALEFFERPEIDALLPKWYTHSHAGKKYNSCAFILEGLFGAFLAHKDYSFKYLCKKMYRRKCQWVNINGYEITNPIPALC